MDQNQISQLFSMLQELNTKVDDFKEKVDNRLRNHEERLANLQQRIRAVEDTVTSITGQPTVPAGPRGPLPAVPNGGYGTNPLPRRGAYTAQLLHRGPPQQTSSVPPRILGSSEKAGFLPYAMEHIAKKHQRRAPDDTRNW
jgi:hypothetical protein